jgi:hypothetical protein
MCAAPAAPGPKQELPSMCWGIAATLAMTGAGAAATAVTLRRGDPPAFPLALGYFTLMEALQLGGYLTLDQCGTPANETVTLLSVLHIAFQPLVINAFAMALVGRPLAPGLRGLVVMLAGLAVAVMLLQLYPFGWAGTCTPGATLCAERLCTVSGDWHIAWDVPYNGLLAPLDAATGLYWGFYGYMLTVFLLPLFYGAWRFVLFHALAGPVLAGLLTGNPNEVPAVWCLFSIGLVLIGMSPAIRRRFAPARPAPT